MSNDGGGGGDEDADADAVSDEKSGEKKSNTSSSELIREIESAKAESIGEINLIESNPNGTVNKHEFVTPEIVEQAIKVSLDFGSF